MFSKTSNKSRNSAPALGLSEGPRLREVPSIIGPDMTVVGNIRCDGEVQIDGVLQGDVTAHVLTIGERATVRGAISVDSVRICGTVHGSVNAREVVLLKTAHMIGDVNHETLSIEAGAQIDGNCRRLEPAKSAVVVSEARWEPVVPPLELAAGE